MAITPHGNNLAARMISILCCLIFVFFSIIYLVCFQGDMMKTAQHLMSNGRTSYQVLLFSSMITLFLTILGLVLGHFIKYPPRFKAVVWFPSFMILGWLTDVSLNVVEPTSKSVGIFPFILFAVFYLVSTFILCRIQIPKYDKSSLQSLLWPNLAVLCISIFFVCGVGNTNRTLHYELRMERYAENEMFDKLLEVGKDDPMVSRRIMYLRVYALSRKGMLGDYLFQYPNNLGSESILPDPKDSLRPYNLPAKLKAYLGKFPIHDMKATNFLQYIACDSVVSKPVQDYLLCAFLLDKNLGAFADSLVSFYADKDSIEIMPATNQSKKNSNKAPEPYRFKTLPRHYAEALLLYSRLNENPVAVLDDDKTLENYLDFSEYREKKDSCEREAFCRIYYDDTYWCYYFFSK